MAKRKICVVTGTRAEYGLLSYLMKEIQEDDSLELQVIATGTHLSKEFGETYTTIEKDGFKINAKIDLDLSDDSPLGVTKSLGLGVIGFGKAIDELKPDLVVVLGDRYELLAATQAALIFKIPVAHIHGGETTEGAFDEAIRHSITKMSHFHFVAHDDYRKRVIQLGENPDRVFNFGAIGLDHLTRMEFLTRSQVEEALQFKLGEVNFLVTYHPVTLSHEPTSKALDNLFEALKAFPQAKIILTKSNSDTDGKIIGKKLDEFAIQSKGQAAVYDSLGQKIYLSLMKYVDVVIGNSSSGILEAPAFKVPTINIGPRQRGRLRAKSIIECEAESNQIIETIKKALSKEFKESFENTAPPYKAGNASRRVKDVLKEVSLKGLLMKKFYDLETK
jgi:GDP/UDP-N,N'-diacetylbacillosamine 2-epimerase (hydrolysing)